jgi:hypothetical protein
VATGVGVGLTVRVATGVAARVGVGFARGTNVATGGALRAGGAELGEVVGVGAGVAVGELAVGLAPLMACCGCGEGAGDPWVPNTS